MYERVMGTSFNRLALDIQRFHRLAGQHRLYGRVEVLSPRSAIAALLARLLGTPRSAGDGAITFELDAQTFAEIWTRHFPSSTMTSRLQLIGGQLDEKLGVARLRFALSENNGQLNMHLQQLHFVGIPCPTWLMPRILAEETGRNGRLYFRVRAEVPGVGLVASYQGYLELPETVAA